ncbi:MAG: hypothetical protein OXD49_18090 [Candidatus Poribacteria bacterium]|nr:hypothetical protein [Candidatus Poribacteria bacterium]
MKAKFLRKCCPFPVQRVATLFAGNLRVAFKTCCVVLLLLTIPLAHAAEVEDFIPKESVLYVKLQDIDEVYGEIEISENWEKALALLQDLSDWREMQQGLVMFQGMLGTDLSDIIETVGYRTALAVWLDEADSSQRQIGIVIHSGGNLDTLRQLTKIVEGFLGIGNETTLRLDAGVYQRVRYNVLEGLDSPLKYGFVDEYLVIGAGEGSFEKLLDTYRTDLPSIQQKPEFAKGLEKIGSGEVIVYANVPHVLPAMEGSLDRWMRAHFPIFKSVFGQLNLLETGPFLQVAVEYDLNLPENEIGMFLKEGQRLKTLNALSGEDDLFVTVAPKVVESIWKSVPTSDAAEGISFLEGLMNLDLEEDIMTGLTGELALSIPDLTHFDPEALSGFRFEFDGSIELDAGDVQTNGGLVFNSSNRMKWDQIGNSLSNLQNASVSQTDYKGATVSAVSSNIFYSEVDGLFLIGFSENQMYALIDTIKRKKKPPYLKQLPKTPTAFAQLNLARVLEFEKGALPADKLLVNSKEMPRLLTWLSVEGDAAVLEMTISEETPIEMLAKLVPFFIWNMDVIWWE